MNIGRRIGAVMGIAAFVVLATPALAYAAVAITVPPQVSLGSVPSGTSSLSGQMGTVTVTASALIAPSFTAKVSATEFTTGTGTASERITKASISYWSGPATAALLQNATPGQVDADQALDLSVTRTAFRSTGLVASITTTWNPTIVVTIPPAAVAGTYTGTITHSVA